MAKWGLYAVLWALAMMVNLDFAEKSSRGMSIQAYVGMDNGLFRNARARPSGIRSTASR